MLKKALALLVDGNEENLKNTAEQLSSQRFEILQARSLLDANRQLDELTPDLAVIALDLPDGDGLALLAHPGLDRSREIILTHGEDDPNRVRKGILAGANYFFCRPVDKTYLRDLFDDLAGELTRPDPLSRDGLSAPNPIEQFALLHGSSPPMHKLYRALRKVASTNACVFLIGECGTGKELVAHSIHRLSERRAGPFVALNCGAVSAEVIESELFGQEKGGLAGAERHVGCFEQAYGGTLFLDDITAMSGDIQVKLLRALETNQFRPLSGEADIQADLRIIAATDRNPDEPLRTRPLREDLQFRIASFPLHIPPLRARGSDICGLAELFIEEFNEQSGKEKFLSRDAAAVLETYSWPGNVRELRSIIEQAYIMAEHDITPEHLPDMKTQPASSGNVLQLNIGDSVQDAEKKLTLATLSYYNGDKRRAAQTLGVSLKTLYNRINAYQANKHAPSVSSATH